ncbi:metal ABC transporter ATP-binding protein [Jeongeupia chitinilytica]|uniref:ABC transporter ATP-binding protein n=1 Tax=Jeongeupia chitinilytica TaxID=1041641 RepID=A0ABQ3GVY8_9NEIS|nr:ABC transporter ATP-binding protein [Jeongeupia chitinilytica]GHD57001.1 ABC transporter ATP-binding protein [Jeongeupia chitinilytica]
MITLDHVCVKYRQRLAVAEVCGTFATGRSTAIVGPNGAGKTTLLKAMAGLLPLASGQIHAPERVAYLPQRTELDRQFPMTVAELALSGSWRRSGAWRRLDRAEQERATHALAHMGLAELANRPIGTLSGGQLQRARFARLMVQDAPVLLLDEPLNNLDPASRDLLLKQLTDWQMEGRTVIAVMHDLDLVSRHFDETLLLSGTVQAWGTTPAVLAAARAEIGFTGHSLWVNPLAEEAGS